MKSNDLTEGSIWKGLFLFALPLLGTSLIQQMYNTVDLMFVGKLLGKGAAAAVGSTSLLTVCIIGFFNGLGVGVGVITAQFFGAREYNDVSRAIHTSAGLTLVFAAIITAAGWLSAPFLLKLMHIPGDIMDLSLTYIRIYILSIIFIVSYNTSSGILRALGNSRTPMICQLAGGFMNIIANTLFIYVLKLGIAGAAYATMLSQSVAAFLTVYCLCRLPEEYRLKGRRIRIVPYMAKKIFFIGIPEALRSMIITFANLILQSQINTFGVDSMAAYASYCKTEGFIYMPQWAVGQANTTFVGQNLGAGKADRAEKSTRTALVMAVGITLCVCGLILLFPCHVFGIFSNDADIIALSVKIGRRTYALYFLYAVVEVLSGAVRGSGNSVAPMVISVFNMCVVRLVVLKIAMRFFDTVYGIAIVFPITWITTCLSIVIYYKYMTWKRKNR